jgi:ABC-2 type transport system ATP-binding protein
MTNTEREPVSRMSAPGSATVLDPPAVRLLDLHKSFGHVQAVAGVDLTVERGETVALLGPNGAGKSTTVDLLLGLSTPDRGSADLLGRSPREAIAQGLVGAMLQTGGMPRDARARDLVELVASLHAHPMPVDEALRRAGADGFGRQRVERLSGGQTQRLRLALALLPDPDLLVLDEPTSAMDVNARRTFWHDMAEFTGSGRTVLFTTHQLEEADAYADRIVLLRSGRVVADGTTAQVKAMVGLRRLRARVPDAQETRLRQLPGVMTVTVDGETVALGCTDSDAALRALLAAEPGAHDIEVGGAALEDAFLALTAGESTLGAGAAEVTS